jgi:chaperonin GroES
VDAEFYSIVDEDKKKYGESRVDRLDGKWLPRLRWDQLGLPCDTRTDAPTILRQVQDDFNQQTNNKTKGDRIWQPQHSVLSATGCSCSRSKREKSKKAGSSFPIPPRKSPRKAKVIAIGTGKIDDEGKKKPFEVKVGDRVLISKYGGTEIKIDGTAYQVLREDDILGILA